MVIDATAAADEVVDLSLPRDNNHPHVPVLIRPARRNTEETTANVGIIQ